MFVVVEGRVVVDGRLVVVDGRVVVVGRFVVVDGRVEVFPLVRDWTYWFPGVYSSLYSAG